MLKRLLGIESGSDASSSPSSSWKQVSLSPQSLSWLQGLAKFAQAEPEQVKESPGRVLFVHLKIPS